MHAEKLAPGPQRGGPGSGPLEDSVDDDVAAWVRLLSDVCGGCGCRGLDASGRCPRCQAVKPRDRGTT